MKYIEEKENVTREYEVIIDDVALSKIVEELNEKCCRAVKVSINVRAQKDRAYENFNTIGKSGVDIVRRVEDSTGKETMSLYECEFFRKQNPQLSYILTTALRSYRSTVGYSINDNTIKMLLEYANSEELKPYQVRMAENGITQELYDEYENNKDFDFALLNELYEKAKECFKLLLISEKTDYKDVDKDARIYKLGSR